MISKLLGILALTTLIAGISCRGPMTVEEYAAACGDLTKDLSDSKYTARSSQERTAGMDQLTTPDELANFHNLLIHPTWNSVNYRKDITRTLEEEVGIDVYSEDESFEEMLAQLEAEAVRKWGDEASRQLARNHLTEKFMDQGQRRLEYGTSLAEAITNLTPIVR